MDKQVRAADGISGYEGEGLALDTAPTTAGASTGAADTAAHAPKNLWELVAPAHKTIIASAIVAFVGSVLRVCPYIALVEIGRKLLGGNTAGVWAWVGFAIVTMLIQTLTYAWALGSTHIAEAKLRSDLRRQLISRLSLVPLGYFNDRSSARIRKAVTSDTTSIHTLVAHAAGDIATTVGSLLAGIAYLLYIDPAFTGGLIVLWVVIIVGIMGASSYNMAESFTQFAAAERELSQATVELVDGIKEVKNFQMTASMFGRFEQARRHHTDISLTWMKKSGLGVSIITALIQPAATLTITVCLGFWLTTVGWLSPIDVLAFALVWVGIPEGLQAFMQISQYLYTAKQAATSTLEVLQTKPLPATAPASGTTGKAAPPSEITVKNVTFSYEPGHPVLRDISFTCAPGTITALVGPSGSGKSTLGRLIARFWDVDEGTISVGGVDVRQQSSYDLLKHMALVFQDIMVTSASVRDNIALGMPDASDNDTVEAARAAQIHDRIMELPHGYDTVLGEDGAFLSGGELQRLTIARAMLRKPDILLLDEATSQADAHCELQIQRAISQLAATRTVVMIAHRLSTIAGADQILVLEDGQITERGTHGELLARGGTYARLWHEQNPATEGEEGA